MPANSHTSIGMSRARRSGQRVELQYAIVARDGGLEIPWRTAVILIGINALSRRRIREDHQGVTRPARQDPP
jgi:hypothetical protein